MLRPVVFVFLFLSLHIGFAASVDSTLTDSTRSFNKYIIVNNINVTGNTITQKKIILRELPFKAGDTIPFILLQRELLRAKNNIMNTSLFNFVNVDTVPFYADRKNISIDVAERWYIFPVPIFEIAERNFNTWLENPNLARANYGFYVNDENFRGLKEKLSLKVRFGYAEQYGLTYTIPYLDQRQISGMGFDVSYNRNQEIGYKTYGDQLYYFKDPGKYIRDAWVGRINYSRRSGLYNTYTAEMRFIKSSIADTVVSLTKDYFSGNSTIFEMFVASCGFRRDFRDSKVYPLKGYYFGIDIVKQGLGILKDESVNILYTSIAIRKYAQLHDRLYLGASVESKISTYGKQPYYIQRALGYGDYVRGYELYVIDGQNHVLFQSDFRYQLIKTRVLKLNALPAKKFNTIPYTFYLSAFADAAYVDDKFYYQYYNNHLPNTWLVGYGVGLDFVTYYDTVMRFEYAWNGLGQNGFFIHLGAPF